MVFEQLHGIVCFTNALTISLANKVDTKVWVAWLTRCCKTRNNQDIPFLSVLKDLLSRRLSFPDIPTSKLDLIDKLSGAVVQNGPARAHARRPDHPTVVGPVPPSRPHPPPSPTGARRS